MSSPSTFWETLSANTLRSMCKDLGFSFLSSREQMLTYLKIAVNDPEEATKQAQEFKKEFTEGAKQKRKAEKDTVEEGSPSTGKRARKTTNGDESLSAGRRTRAAVAADEAPRRSARGGKTSAAPAKPKAKAVAKKGKKGAKLSSASTKDGDNEAAANEEAGDKAEDKDGEADAEEDGSLGSSNKENNPAEENKEGNAEKDTGTPSTNAGDLPSASTA